MTFLAAQSFQLFQTSDFVARMATLSSKLEVCLPLAYPSTIYKHISLLRPMIFSGTNKLPHFVSWTRADRQDGK